MKSALNTYFRSTPIPRLLRSLNYLLYTYPFSTCFIYTLGKAAEFTTHITDISKIDIPVDYKADVIAMYPFS